MSLSGTLRHALIALVFALSPAVGSAVRQGLTSAVVQVDIRSSAMSEQLLGVIIHTDANVVHVLAPLTPLMTSSARPEPQRHVIAGSERFAVSKPFFLDARLGFCVLTIERRVKAADEAPTLVARAAGANSAGTAFDSSLRAVSVDTPQNLGSTALGSPVIDSADKVSGFVAMEPSTGRRVVAASDVMRVLRTDWQIPANRLIPFRSLRSSAKPLSFQDVASIMTQPGFRWPRGSTPAARGALPGDLQGFATEVGRRLREDAAKPAAGAVPPVERVSFHKFESRKLGNDTIVVDHATGLTWLIWNAQEWRSFCKARIDQLLSFDSAKGCINLLNESRVAGRRDWRMPTLEELASLLAIDAVAQADGARFHVDPIFGTADGVTWSADPLSGENGMQWGVCFSGDNQYLACGTPLAWPSSNPGRLFVVRSTQ